MAVATNLLEIYILKIGTSLKKNNLIHVLCICKYNRTF